MIVGYVRIGSADHDALAQCDALTQAGCAHITVERLSLAASVRPKFEKLLASLGRGDVLVVPHLGCLGYSLASLAIIWKQLDDDGITLRSLGEGIDSATEQGRLAFTILCDFTAVERKVIAQRTQSGMENARRRGVKLGRPRVLTQSQVNHARKLIEDGQTLASVARAFGVNRATVQRAIGQER